MNRREFSKFLGASALALRVPSIVKSAANPAPQFAITMDDFRWRNAVHLTAENRNRSILDALNSHRAKAALFVVGESVDNEKGKSLRYPAEDGEYETARMNKLGL